MSLSAGSFFSGIMDLPEEILEQILSLICPYTDYKPAMLVCKLWHKIMQGVHVQEASRFRQSLVTGNIKWSSQAPMVGSTITDRYLHSALYFDKSIYIFGGCSANSTAFNDLWIFELSSRKWDRPLATGNYPSPKACSSLVEFNGVLILFGGFSHAAPYPLHQAARFFNELHTYCPISKQWVQIVSVYGAQGQIQPPGIAGHTASVVRDSMIVIGGSHHQGHSCMDIWELNLSDMSWKYRNVNGIKPRPRYGHSQAVLDENHLLVSGGCGGPNTQFNDLWLLNVMGDTWTWQEMKILGTIHSPPQLWFHPSCKVGDKMVVLSKLSARSPRNSDLPASSLQKIKLSKLLVLPRVPVKSHENNDHKQVAKRHLPETSESSSQDSSSDTEDLPRAIASTSVQSEKSCESVSPNKSPSSSPAPRLGLPSVRPNAMRNRQKQLEALKRYEDRIKRHMKHGKEGLGPSNNQRVGAAAAASSDESDSEFVPSCLQQQRPNHPMYLHVLDVSKAVADGTVEWLPVPEEPVGRAPEETILYSLVHGRGEIVMFGGIKSDASSMQMGMNIPPQVVSNNLHFIKAQHHFR